VLLFATILLYNQNQKWRWALWSINSIAVCACCGTKSGLTQAQLAKILLLPRVTYTHYELGKRTPDLDTIIRMARHFGVTVDYLVGNSDFELICL
jgi:DNA-binding XRE family transcriptional regulator